METGKAYANFQDLLLKAHRDSHVQVRLAAARTGLLLSDAVVGALVQALQDKKAEIRAAAAESLGRLRATRAIGSLFHILTHDRDGQVRAAAAQALAQMGDAEAVESLGRALEDGEGQAAAALALGTIRDPRSVEPLVSLLSSGSRQERCLAAQLLGEMGDPRAVEPLLDVLQQRDRGSRMAAAEALGKLDDPRAVKPLIEKAHPLPDPSMEKYGRERQAYEGALSLFRHPEAVEVVISALESPEVFGRKSIDTRWHASVRETAVRVLGAMGDPKAVEPLIGALAHRQKKVRYAVIAALGAIGDPRAVAPLSRMLGDKDPHVRFTAARALAAMGDAGIVEPLVASLDDRQVCLGIMGDYTPLSGSASAMSRYEIFQAENGTGTFATVYQGTSYLCEAAADRLSRIGHAQATEALMSGLKHQTELVRSIAALALVRLGDNKVLARLFSVLNRAEYDEARVFEGALAALGRRAGESYARQAGAEALGRLGDPRAVPHLIEALSDRQRNVGAAAARALREFDSSQVTEVLIETLKPLVDEDAEEPLSPLSPSICWTLGQFRAEQAIPLLMEAIWCRDAVHAAAEVLIEIGNPPVDPLIDALEAEENWVREAAAHVLCELGPRARDAVPDLVQALEEESESVRSVVATALGKIGGKQAAAALVASHKDRSAKVREAVERAFIALNDMSQETAEELFPVLEAKDERMRLAAALAMGQSAQIGLMDRLGNLLEDKNWQVRQGATCALGIMGMELTMKGALDSPRLAELV